MTTTGCESMTSTAARAPLRARWALRARVVRPRRSRWIGLVVVALGGLSLGGPVGSTEPERLGVYASQGQPSATVEILWQEARRQFGAFRYAAAIETLDRLIGLLNAEEPSAQRTDSLVQAYELRARARFASGDPQGAEVDFARLIELQPEAAPSPGISPRIVALFDSVRARLVGQVDLEVTPEAAEVTVDDRPVTLESGRRTLALLAGSHALAVRARAHRPLTQTLTVTPGSKTPLAVHLERIAATLSLTTEPAGVEVTIDGVVQGTTAPEAAGSAESGPLLVDLELGPHRLTFRRPCYVTAERDVVIDRLADLRIDAVRLTPAVASAKVESPVSAATVLLDGVVRGTVASADLTSICEGDHLLEVRSAGGRFIHRDRWTAGEHKTIKAVLRPAFATVGMPDARARRLVPAEALTVERMLQDVPTVLVFATAESDLEVALAEEKLSPETLATTLGDAAAGRHADVVRDVGARLSARLRAQGLAWLAPAADGTALSLAVLASGSGRADVLTLPTADPARREQVLARFRQAPPTLLRPTLYLAAIDLADVKGVAVVRVTESQAAAGLAPGDLIVAADGRPVESASDLQVRAAAAPAGGALTLEVRGRDGSTRQVKLPVIETPNPLRLGNRTPVYNKVLLEMREALRTAGGPLEQAVARLNLGIAHLSLGDWDEALDMLRQVELPDGPGVSGGTVAYLMGLCYEALSRSADARAAFTRAAGVADSTLWFEGPLVAPLAQQRLAALR